MLAFLKWIPAKAWLVISGIAFAIGAFLLHQHIAHNQLKAADAAGYSRAEADIAAKARTLKDRMDAVTRRMSEFERKLNSEKIGSSNARADALLLRGPGKASCPRNAVAAAPAGGRQPAAGPADGAVAGVPDAGGPELIALPFPGAVGAAKACDANLIDNASWRSWYAKLVKAWPR